VQLHGCTSFRNAWYVSGRCGFKGRCEDMPLSWHPRMHWLRERKELHERYNHPGDCCCRSLGVPSGDALVCRSRPQAQEARRHGRDAQRRKARGFPPQQEIASHSSWQGPLRWARFFVQRHACALASKPKAPCSSACCRTWRIFGPEDHASALSRKKRAQAACRAPMRICAAVAGMSVSCGAWLTCRNARGSTCSILMHLRFLP
jgi:hypothetical protein